jgi:hypothetical protein
MDRVLLCKCTDVIAPMVLIAARIVRGGVGQLWRDWVVVVSLYWLYTRVAQGSRTWPIVTMLTMSYLFAIYLVGYLPHFLRFIKT